MSRIEDGTARRRGEECHAETAVARALGEAAGHRWALAAGRPRSVRGIPMIGGASGEIPGTRPDRNRRLQ